MNKKDATQFTLSGSALAYIVASVLGVAPTVGGSSEQTAEVAKKVEALEAKVEQLKDSDAPTRKEHDKAQELEKERDEKLHKRLDRQEELQLEILKRLPAN